MNNVYSFLLKNRLHKKRKIYKQLLRLSLDVTVIIYTVIMVGYIVAAIIMEGTIWQRIDDIIVQLDAFLYERISILITVLPFIHLIRAYKQPGVIFSRAEYVLTILPHERRRVWLIVAMQRWLKAFVFYSFFGAIFYLLSPTMTLLYIAKYVFMFIGINMLMTIPEWKFFQLHIFKKMMITFGVIILNVCTIFLPSLWTVILIFCLLITYNLFASSRLFHHVDWMEVTSASDYKLWNMRIVSQATKIKFKKERQYSIWQRLNFWKKPFPFNKQAAYNRLWHVYIEKNVGVVLQVIGALIIMLLFLSFVNETIFLFGVALTIHIYTSLIASMLNDRFTTDIVEVLPWDIDAFKETLIGWALVPTIIFIIPFAVFAVNHFSFSFMLQMILIIVTFYLLLRLKTAKVKQLYDKQYEIAAWLDVVSYGFLVMIVLSHPFPFVFIICFVVLGIISFFEKSKINTHLS